MFSYIWRIETETWANVWYC